MSKCFLGLDLGTSSVKVLCRYEDGRILRAKAAYPERSPDGWWQAAVQALSSLDLSDAAALGLSSQVGTYIVNGTDVIGWDSPVGAEEVRRLRAGVPQALFLQEISMPHPEIASYPIPRLLAIRQKHGDGAEVCQPKELLGERLTGVRATDKYSWRGLANLQTGRYSEHFLRQAGCPKLPPLLSHTDLLGTVTAAAAAQTGLPQGLPVYVGLNDFFASLLGMGISGAGELFDITGTSEHLGVITAAPVRETSMVSGPYLKDFVHYGVTASSGASLEFGLRNFGFDRLDESSLPIHGAPIFTPYLNGERAPLFDSSATGMFFGIQGGCTGAQLAYAVLEGVAFSLYHIYEHLGTPAAQRLTVSGGAAGNRLLNRLKAELFDLPVAAAAEPDTSALGAAMVAAMGSGAYQSAEAAAAAFCHTLPPQLPTGRLRPLLMQRFAIYKSLYPRLRDVNKQFKEVQP